MSSAQKLALMGGDPVIKDSFLDYITIDDSDVAAANRVLRSGKLSLFVGDEGPNFLGGPEVRNFEDEFSAMFEVEHAISVNSWTSGLWCAVGALELPPGSEVIVSPWTMAATATTILHWNLVPVFADILPSTFCLDVNDVERRITPRTRAIISPDIFGQSSNVDQLLELCRKYDLRLLTDSAQSPGATRYGVYAGTQSDIGGFSFNYHKHIHTGEGGILVTNSDHYAGRLRLLRNHGEVVVSKLPKTERGYGILGMNLRMGEIEAAIGANQLKKLDLAIQSRKKAARRLSERLGRLPGIDIPVTEVGNSHVYYVYGITLNLELLGVSRANLYKALKAEGIPGLVEGYQNLHKLPLFKDELTYRENPLPYSLLPLERRLELQGTQLPVAERLHDETFLAINLCSKLFSDDEIDLVSTAFEKVWELKDRLH
jgi:dTDP-4-amino-4,6-dideoxygalactose transaminase